MNTFKNFFRGKFSSYTFLHGLLDISILISFALLLFFMSGCTIVDPKIQPIKLECDDGECAVKPNLLICDSENIYCTYIDKPVLTSEDILKYIA